MRTAEKDLVGIILFGTNTPDPKTDTKNVTQLLDLDYPSVETIKQLDKLMEDEDCAQIQQNYGCSDDFLLADALWYCSSLLTRGNVKLDRKRILLFTDDCDPHASHPDHAHMARKRAKDMNQVKIFLELLPIGSD